MPRFDPTAKVFGGFTTQDPFRSRFPDAATMEGSAVNPLWAQLGINSWGTHYVRNFADMSQRALKTVATLEGIPIGRVPGLEEVFAKAPQLSLPAGIGEAFETALGGGKPTLKSALLGFAEGLSLVATAVPIVGWVVKLGVSAYQFADGALKTAAQKVTTPPHSPIAYSRGADQDAVNLQLGYVGEDDMTPLFLPASTQGGFRMGTLDYMGDGQPDGRFFTFAEKDPANGGVMPGIGDRAGYWQYPAKVTAGGNRPSGPESVVTNAQLAPSAVQNGMYLWQTIVKPGVQMFAVDPDKIVSAWLDFFAELRSWALGQGDAQLKDIAWWSATWAKPNGENRYPRWEIPYDTKAVPFGTYIANIPTVGDLIEEIVRVQLRPARKPALRTLICAYVPPNAPALRGPNNAKLRDYHRDMRQKLLDHRAVDDVELDLIPDADYRTAVYYAQNRGPGKFDKGGSFQTPTEGSVDKPVMLEHPIPMVEPDYGEDPEPTEDELEPVLPADAEGGSGDDWMGTALKVFGGVAVVGLAGLGVRSVVRRS